MRPKFSKIRDDFKKYAATWDESIIEKYNLSALRRAKVFYTHPAHETETWFNVLCDRVSNLEQLQTLERENRWRIAPIVISLIALLVSTSISIKSCFNSSEAVTIQLCQAHDRLIKQNTFHGVEHIDALLAASGNKSANATEGPCTIDAAKCA